MVRRISVLLAAFFILISMMILIPACREGYEGGDEYEIVDFVSISRGPSSSISRETRLVIKNEEDLDEMWQNINAVRGLPEVDFSTEMVIAVFMGEKPTGGYEIEITSIREYEDRLLVKIKETEPGPDQMVTQVLTHPYHIVITEYIDKEVEFNITQ